MHSTSETLCKQMRVCGVRDPTYIANLSAMEMGRDDGRGTLCASDGGARDARDERLDRLAARLQFAYAGCIGTRGAELRPLLERMLQA